MDRSPRGNPYRDLDRPPLSEPALRAALVRPGELWSELRIVAETGSTNADLVAAGADAADGTVLIAESQLAGRGRADRTWIAPARAGVTMSVLLRPAVRRQRWGWLPLLAGVAVAEALEAVAMIEVALKWPNDVLAGPGRRKVCGILVQVTGQATGQVTGSAVVIGIGLNVSTTAAELPVDTATSLALEESGCLDRDTLVRAVLRALARQYAGWCAAAGDPDASGLRAAYESRCDTIGADVSVSLPGGELLQGHATGVDGVARLQVATSAGVRAVAAGDVVHVRRAGPGDGTPDRYAG